MLETKLSFSSIDKTGAIIKLKDTTGVYSVDNPTGYGSPNINIGNIVKIIFEISQYNTMQLYRQTYVRVADINHPEYKVTPTINQITSGKEIELSSISLNINNFMTEFNDGIFIINMYSILNLSTPDIIAVIGSPYIIGTELDIYKIYDSILINDILYDIDKTKNTNGGTILYLTKEIQSNSTTFNLAYKTNLKFISTIATQNNLYNLVGKLGKSCKCNTTDLVNKLCEIEMFKWASQYAFDNNDFIQADKLIRAAYKTSKFNCNC